MKSSDEAQSSIGRRTSGPQREGRIPVASGLVALTEMTDVLLGCEDRAAVTRVAAAELRAAFGAAFAILSWDGGIYRLIDDDGGNAARTAALERLDAAMSVITMSVIRTGEPRFIPNAQTTGVAELGLASLAVVPIGTAGRQMGAIILGFTHPSPFTPAERDLLLAAARVVGHAHHHAWMLEGKRAELDTVSYLEQATKLLSQNGDRASLMHSLAALALPRLGDYAIIDVAGDGGSTREAGVAHVQREMEEVVRRYRALYPVDQTNPDAAFSVACRTREPVVVLDLQPGQVDSIARDPEQLRLLQLLHPTAYIVAPLLHFGEVLGTISFVLTSTERRYTPADVVLSAAIAERVSTVLQSMSLLEHSEKARGAAEAAGARLREQAEELERANDSLQDQAVELEQQTEEAQALSEELEMTVAELQQSEVRFRALVEASAQAVWRCDASGAVTETSAGWVQLTGRASEPSDIAPHASAVHPDDRERTVLAWRRAVETGAPFRVEHRIRTANGTYCWYEGRAVPMLDDAGTAVREWVGMHTDVHERRTLADEQQLLLEVGAMTQAHGDADAMVAEVLARLVTHFGVHHCRLIEVDGTAGMVTLHRRHVAFADHRVAAAGPDIRTLPLSAVMLDWERMRTGEPAAVFDALIDSRTAPFYATVYAPEGTRATLSVPLMRAGVWIASLTVVHSAPREWTEQEVTLVRRVGDKIWPAFEAARAFAQLEHARGDAEQRAIESEALTTALARTNEDLAASEALLSGVVGSAMDAIISLGNDDRITVFNAAAERIFGVRAYDALGAALDRFILADGGGALRARGVPQEVVGRRSDGTAFPAEATISRLGGDAGHVTTVVLRDVTERRALESQLVQSQKMEAVGRLAGGVAHDFNNILTVIRSCADFIRESLPLDDERRVDADEVLAATDRASALTRQLLAFSRKQVVMPRVLDVNGVLRGLEPMLRRLIGEDIELAVMLQGSRVPVRADLGQLEQIVINLVVNARDAMSPGGVLSIETDVIAITPLELRRYVLAHAGTGQAVRAGEYAVVRVTDTGSGMDASVLPHVFEPFFTTKPEGRGTGLGLATVHGITVQSGGHIRVKSVVGEGSCFEVLLPLLRATDSGEHLPAVLPARARATGTILLVEDEGAVRRSVRRMLERAGYTVLEARHGADALLVWHENEGEIDLLVTDLRMPELGGRELIAALHAINPDLPAIAMSGYPPEVGADGPDDWMGDGRVQFLAKPFSTEVLLAVVEKAIVA